MKQKKSENESIKQQSNNDFWMKELKEREGIKKESREFRKIVDTVKKDMLEQIEKTSRCRENSMNNEMAQLESALESNDAEQIKAVLKNLS